MSAKDKSKLSSEESSELLSELARRFAENPERHQGLKWQEIEARLERLPDRLAPLFQMELTGGEPDVVGLDKKTGEYIFYDCSPESPKGRRSVCFDAAALESRKEHKPKHSALGMAAEMGVQILSEDEYRQLQTLGEFDLKTSSWIRTPNEIRNLGGALFCDRRFGQVFTYHNGAESYYAARGWRGSLRL